MEKRISYFEYQSVKNVARAIEPHLRTQRTIKAQIERLAEQFKREQAAIDALEEGVVKVIGFHTTDLIKKVVETTDKGAKPKYVSTEIVRYDDETKQYVITVPDEGEEPVPEPTKRSREKKEQPTEPIDETIEQPIGDQVPPEVTPEDFPPFEEHEEQAPVSDNTPFPFE